MMHHCMDLKDYNLCYLCIILMTTLDALIQVPGYGSGLLSILVNLLSSYAIVMAALQRCFHLVDYLVSTVFYFNQIQPFSNLPCFDPFSDASGINAW